ncbi:MAG: alpha/beta hydrolase, partial [Caldilineaceae bacterium]|nr:alpha/beta hydrolase [Caldilineaceae bacterium]
MGIMLGMLAVAIVAVWLSQVYATTPPITDAQGNVVPGSVATLEKVPLNGSEQWVSIRGRDVNNPVLLFLAGVRAAANLPLLATNWRRWKITLWSSTWEQPGAGKSFDAVDQATLTPERYVEDGHEL